MNLIAYSDSDGSDSESLPTAKPAPKAAFRKVVDRANPGKIKLNLPGPSHAQTNQDHSVAETPPAKRARTGGDAFGGFNAMLPAPKKPKVAASGADAPPSNRGPSRGPGIGVNLKTGAEPAFERAPRGGTDKYDENGNPLKKDALNRDEFRAMLNLPPPKSEIKTRQVSSAISNHATDAAEPDVKLAAKPRLVPMSMGRGTKKKKKPSAGRQHAAAETAALALSSHAVPSATSQEQKPAGKPKVSLFSISQESEILQKQPAEEYQPLLFGAEKSNSVNTDEDVELSFQHADTHAATRDTSSTSNHLTGIASELNLTEAERRQLFGRKGQGSALLSTKIVDFNTDAEYAHNEMLRQQGETVQHNALKSITGTGKNSLRSLVNVATTQKDALEEHFAAGRRNKREAGNRYGW